MRVKRGQEEPPDHALGRSRGGWGSKLHLVTDGKGIPLEAHVTAGQVHESTQFEKIITAVKVPEHVIGPQKVAGDKAYSSARIREWLKNHSIEAVIPYRENERLAISNSDSVEFDKESYRKRCVIEQCVGWLKQNRAVTTRYDKLAVNYIATVRFAMICRYLRILTKSSRCAIQERTHNRRIVQLR